VQRFPSLLASCLSPPPFVAGGCAVSITGHPSSTVSNSGATLALGYLHEKPAPHARQIRGGQEMLYTLAVILLVAWLLGLGGVYAIGSIVHLLLVVAIVLFLVGLISGRRTVV
jgi:hypothetical protein